MRWLKTNRRPPVRSLVLMAAKEWGVPPWEVERGPLKWFRRWVDEQDIRTRLASPETFVDDGS